jgi:hypothetical protein
VVVNELSLTSSSTSRPLAAIGAMVALATVTFGWIVMLQVGVMLLDRFHLGNAIPPDRLGVMGAILLLQGYLILAP